MPWSSSGLSNRTGLTATSSSATLSVPNYGGAWRGVAASAQWNPGDTNPSVVLSGGNLTATSSAAHPIWAEPGRCTAAILPGQKKFFSAAFPVIQDTQSDALGLANSGYNVMSNLSALTYYPGVDNTACVLYDHDDAPLLNGSYVAAMGIQFVATDVVDWAVDRVNNRAWVRKNGGQWNGTVNGNPATNTGGFDISALGTGVPIFPMFTVYTATLTAQCTAKFAAPFTFAPPVGFIAV